MNFNLIFSVDISMMILILRHIFLHAYRRSTSTIVISLKNFAIFDRLGAALHVSDLIKIDYRWWRNGKKKKKKKKRFFKLLWLHSWTNVSSRDVVNRYSEKNDRSKARVPHSTSDTSRTMYRNLWFRITRRLRRIVDMIVFACASQLLHEIKFKSSNHN